MPIYEKLMGNLFVDAGVCGICEWLDGRPQPDEIKTEDLKMVLEEFVPMAANWEKWTSIFTRNHRLTNGREHDRVPKFKKRLLGYIDQAVELGQNGDCIGCGRRNVGSIPLLDKTGVPLTGGKNSNFFPVFSEGASYCPACCFAIQFLPFSLVATGKNGGRFLMLHSQSWELMQIWTIRCIKSIRQQYSRQQSGGCFKPDYENSRNGLFYMVREMINELKEMQLYADIVDENVSMEVYSFTNNNQFPDVEIFYIPSSVFQFLCDAEQNTYKKAWHEVVRSGYKTGKSEKDFRKTRNLVYEYLLENRSIRSFFLNRRTQKILGNWELLSLYLQEVRKMKPARLEKIKQVGDLIAESIHKSGRRGENRLREFADAKTYAECRNVLLRIIEDRIRQKEPQPLFSFEECMEHLFISSEDTLSWSDELDDRELDDDQIEQLTHSIDDNVTFWRETRDLLLFRIYEKLHSWLTEQEDN